MARLHEENRDIKNLIQDWEEWYEEKEEARQGEVTQVQEISSSPEVPTVEEVGTRLDTTSMWHGRWMMLIAMSHNDFLVSGAGWKRGRITFIISPILCPICTLLSYEVLGMAVLDGCPITLD